MSYDADLKLFIDGAWKSGEDRDAFPVVNPATAQTIADVPMATEADLDEALSAAQRALPGWRSTDVEKRAAILHKAAALLRERSDAIGSLMTQEQGKPIAEAKSEVIGAASMFDWYADEIKRDYGRLLVRPTGQRSMVIHQPVGAVATFTPWNFPIYLLAKKVAAALAAGCTVISKPPEETPGCTGAVARALDDAGLPKGVFQLVHGVPDMVSRHLIGSDVIRKVSFTGIVPVGKHLMNLRADGVKRLTLELGRPCAGADFRRLRPGKDARHGRAAEISKRRTGMRLADPLLRAGGDLRSIREGICRAHRASEGRQRPRRGDPHGTARQCASPGRHRRLGPRC